MRRADEKPPEDHWRHRFPELEKNLLMTYYKFKGWHHNGVPTRKRLEELDLADVAQVLEERRILGNGQDLKKKVKTIRIEADKCNGCRTCEVMCAAYHAEPKWSSVNTATARIHVITHRLKDIWLPVFAGEYAPAECMGRDAYIIEQEELDIGIEALAGKSGTRSGKSIVSDIHREIIPRLQSLIESPCPVPAPSRDQI